MKVAIVEKYTSRNNFKEFFSFDYDLLAASSKPIDGKLKKADIDLEFDEDVYDFIILIGADVAKLIGKISSVVKYQGYLLDDKYIPLINPAMIRMKPAGLPAFEKAVKNINNYISGDTSKELKLDIKGIQSKSEAIEYLFSIYNNKELETIAMDTETTCLYPRDGYVLGICISHKEKQGVYISSDIIDDEVCSIIQKIVDKLNIVFHNAKFDIPMLEYHFGLVIKNFDDTMLLHYCLDETTGTHALKDLAIKFTDYGDYDRELEEFKSQYCKLHKIKKGDFTYDLIPFEIMWPYAATDPAVTLEIYNKFYPVVKKSKKLSNVYNEILIPGTEFLIQMQDNGVPFDKDRLDLANNSLSSRISKLEKELYEYKEIHSFEAFEGKIFNVNSVVHLRTVFFDILGLPPTGRKTEKGMHSTDEESLLILAEQHALPNLILKIKKTKKIQNTYIKKVLIGLDRDSRLRTNFNLSTTTSGRLSSSGKLNMQQLPRNDKTPKWCIRARKGWNIVSQDLKTAEMYVAAVLSGDKNLQKVFIDKVDYHGFMAVNKFGLPCSPNEVAKLYPDLRQEAKTISFEILYKLNMNEPALKNFPTLKKWLQRNSNYIKDNGFIYSILGRKRRLKDVFSSNQGIVSHEIRSGINFLVQSTSSDINLLAAINMQKYIVKNKMKAKIFALVHDSILAEVPDEEMQHYTEKLAYYTQLDYGVMIPNCPIGLDLEIGEDYSFKEDFLLEAA